MKLIEYLDDPAANALEDVLIQTLDEGGFSSGIRMAALIQTLVFGACSSANGVAKTRSREFKKALFIKACVEVNEALVHLQSCFAEAYDVVPDDDP